MMPGQQARKREQDEARREQQADERVRELEEALRTVRRHVYGSRSAFQAEDAGRELGHFGAPRAVKITDTDGEHPSACSYRVEAIEVVAEEIESALDGGGESTDA